MKTLLKTCGQVLRSWPFLLNLAVILLLTCWLPLLTQTMEMRDGAGNLVQQNTITSRVYESWWIVIRMAPGMKGHLGAVALHFGMCFFITLCVWVIRMYPRQESPKVEADNGDADAGDS